jgi:hypothetical protein
VVFEEESTPFATSAAIIDASDAATETYTGRYVAKP